MSGRPHQRQFANAPPAASGPIPTAEEFVRPEAFQATPRLLIRASAGTGKTFQLSNRYLSLLRHCPPDRILAVTFTRKAAGEILDRILCRLASAVLSHEERRTLSGFLGGPTLSQQECEQLLTTLVRQLHRVKVATLDSFFSRLATAIPLEIGLPPNWTIADEHASGALRLRAIDQVLQRSSEQATRRLVHLLAKGIVPRSIANLMTAAVQTHFDIYRTTEKAAWQRIEPPPPLAADVLEQTLLGLEQLDLSQVEFIRKAHAVDVVRCRNGDWEQFLKAGPASKLVLGETVFSRKELPGPVQTVYGPLIQHARSILLKIWADQVSAVHELLTQFHAVRRELVAETQALRFDDVAIALAERMSGVDARSLAHRLDGDIDHLLLDEFQDTSLLQWSVLSPFVQALDSRPDSTFFCVGDVKQAIYGWRGGVAALFDKVARDVSGVQSGCLNESRRSAPAVMAAVNRVFQNLTRHPNLGPSLDADLAAWQTAFPVHSTALTNASGYVSLETAPGPPGDAEANRANCVGRAVGIVAELGEHARDLTIGVLTRKNEMVGRVIHGLAAVGIQASEEGGVKLTTSAAVQLIQSLLRFADHPGDTTALFHIAHSPLAQLFQLQPHMPAAAAERAALGIRSELVTRGYEVAVERWSNALKPCCSPREWSRLRRLCVLAAAYEPIAGLRPSDFANRIDEERVEEPSASAVRVMTIHKSKGLEFDVVVLPDLDFDLCDTPKVCVGAPGPAEQPDTVLIYRNDLHNGLLPPALKHAIEQQRRADVHESLCCLYVAMTRAARALHMVIAPQPVKKDGGTSFQKSAAGLLRATLSDQPDARPGQRLFDTGDASWFEEIPQRKTGPADAPNLQISGGAIPIGLRTGARVRGRETTSPSQAKGTSTALRASRLLSLDSAAGMERGTLWHLWCQQVQWLEDGEPGRQRVADLGRPYCRSDRQLQEELDAFLAVVQRDPVRSLFVRAACIAQQSTLGPDISPACSTEWRFSILDEGRCLTGSIDRLVLYRRGEAVVGADVIDFKTDLGGPASPLRDAYRNQLRQYGRAVAVSHQLEPASIRLSLVWLSTGIVENVVFQSETV